MARGVDTMIKWASYAITRARYDDSRTRVVKVEVHEVTDGRIGPNRVWPRGNIVHLVEGGFRVVTAGPGGGSSLAPTDTVRLVRLDGEDYLRIDDEAVPRDDLGELPEV